MSVNYSQIVARATPVEVSTLKNAKFCKIGVDYDEFM